MHRACSLPAGLPFYEPAYFSVSVTFAQAAAFGFYRRLSPATEGNHTGVQTYRVLQRDVVYLG
jgi:hypothetical protein